MGILQRSRYADHVLAILRIVAGGLFVTFGTMKLFGVPPMPAGTPPIAWASQMGAGGMLEVLGGTLIVLGLLTRPVAFVLSGEMAVAYWQFHAPQSPFPSVNMGVPAVLYCFLYLYLAFAGAGAWSVDGILTRRRAHVDSTVAGPNGGTPPSAGS